MAGYQWTKTKPSAAGWYWFRGPAHEADPFVVQVDEVGQFQWPDGGFQGWEGSSQTILLARRTRTMKLCSSDARSEGQSGCSP